jgi:uncharacterized protein (TIGR03083 family)
MDDRLANRRLAGGRAMGTSSAATAVAASVRPTERPQARYRGETARRRSCASSSTCGTGISDSCEPVRPRGRIGGTEEVVDVDLASGHRDGQQRVDRLVRSLSAERLDVMVPLNPAWRVRDVVAHMAGVCEDLLSGNVPDISDPKEQPDQAIAREAWTQAQVDRRRDVPFPELLEEWDRLARSWELVLRQDPAAVGISPAVFVTASLDVGCHLHDLRHALGDPGDRDAPTTAVAFAIARSWLGMRLDSARLPALRMRCADDEWVLGHRPVGHAVTGEAFELFRAITGRRHLDQLLGLDWDDDPTAILDAVAPYPLPEHLVTE